VISILEKLHQYVPRLSCDDLLTVPTHGDCLAVERMVDAKKARLADLTSYTRLEGLEPVPQEFHHRALMLQVNSYATLRKVANITNNVMQLFERLTVS